MKFHSIFLLIFSFVVLSCNGQTSKNVKTIEAKAFAEKIKETPNSQILDVRTPEEFASDHIDNAKNVNWLGNTFVTDAEKLDKSKPVFVYCKSGGRSQKASEKLSELGFTTIYQLDGGILKWDAAGLSKPSDKIIGMCSQEYAELLNSDKKVLIDFYAEWCAPCKKMTPYLLQMQKDLANNVTIIRLNADENKTLMAELKISELPTLLLYKNAAVKWKHSGFISEDDLKKQLQ
ncbi:thioredoxin domain-containing protein [Flavobacterium sp. AED]|jgi:thioredoxin|uniref:thioredoxin domain-containing protein n=1 Tax=Flavobacterium sp. AED TaxID=1423323 RepID=UPI00057EAAC0|nr:thioredoxin domain-containing protein [Flavobacterium sp. AED]KIA85174.1 thioredoxin [Flavobacterium sp. AED]MDI1305132.1 thioredoxin domain-containing protein [bacterium]